MNKIHFIISIVLIIEVCFRLWPAPQKDENGVYIPETEYHFYPLNHSETDTPSWYVYHIFEHVKVILLCCAIAIVFSRYWWLPFLFMIDLASYLLNYSSIWGTIGGFPIGVDIIKLITFGIIVYTHERKNYSDHDEPWRLFAHARSFLFTSLHKFTKEKGRPTKSTTP